MGRDKMPMMVLAGSIVVGALLLSGVSLASLAVPLILLACPLMMVFMMRGMDHGGGHEGHSGGCHGGQAAHRGTDQHQEHEPEPAPRPVGENDRR